MNKLFNIVSATAAVLLIPIALVPLSDGPRLCLAFTCGFIMLFSQVFNLITQE